MSSTESRRVKTDREADAPFFGYLFAEKEQSAEAVGWKPLNEFFPPAYSVNAVVYKPLLPISGGIRLEMLTTIDQVTNDPAVATAAANLRRTAAGFSTLEANWDDEGAVPVSKETIQSALQVIEHIAVVLERKRTASSPSVLVFPDGSIFFKWIHGSKELNITVEGRNITAQRWQPLDAYRSLGMWPISVDDTSEQVEWVLS